MAKTEITVAEDRPIAVKVTLSRRNLLALLHKLDMEGSQRTIQNNDTYVNGKSEPYVLLTLTAEDDEVHYGKRIEKYGEASGPGMMHPDTEAFIIGSEG